MKIEEQLKKATAESEYWFQKFNSADADLTYHIATLASADAMAAEFRQKCISLSTRLELISDIQRQMWKTGAPLPSWLMGGVIEEKLKELLREVSEYDAPKIISEAKLSLNRPRSRFKVSREAEDYIKNLETTVQNLMTAVQKQENQK